MNGQTTKQQFLQRVRQSLGRSEPLSEAPVPPVVDEALIRLANENDNLPAMFIERASEVGMDVRPCPAKNLAKMLVDVLNELDAKKVTISLGRLPNAEQIEQAVHDGGIDLAAWRDDRAMTAHYDADAGVTDVHAALAETGTLICHSDAEHCRGGSFVPPNHVAIVRQSDIMPDMLDYFAQQSNIAPAQMPSSVVMITGPSKTADIEGVMITGVHGPGKVIVLLIEDQ